MFHSLMMFLALEAGQAELLRPRHPPSPGLCGSVRRGDHHAALVASVVGNAAGFAVLLPLLDDAQLRQALLQD